MLKNVQIIEKSSGHIVAEYPIVTEIVETEDENYIEDAWENAVEEGLVDEDNRNNYDIEIVVDVEDIPPE